MLIAECGRRIALVPRKCMIASWGGIYTTGAISVDDGSDRPKLAFVRSQTG